MIKLGAKSEDGPSTRQKVITKCLWMVSTCRNAIVVVATGLLGYWFVATYGQPPVRLMGTYLALTSLHNVLCSTDLNIFFLFLCKRQPRIVAAVSSVVIAMFTHVTLQVHVE